jgi:hypothetical protein
MPPSRIAFLVFVVLAAIVIILELRARSAHKGTLEAIDQAWEKAEKEGRGLYQEELDKLIQGSPSRERDEQTRTETFTWRGLLRPHRIKVEYGGGGFVKNYSTP